MVDKFEIGKCYAHSKCHTCIIEILEHCRSYQDDYNDIQVFVVKMKLIAKCDLHSFSNLNATEITLDKWNAIKHFDSEQIWVKLEEALEKIANVSQ